MSLSLHGDSREGHRYNWKASVIMPQMITVTMSLLRRVTEVCVVMTLYGSSCVVMVLMGSFISNIAHYFDETISIR